VWFHHSLLFSVWTYDESSDDSSEERAVSNTISFTQKGVFRYYCCQLCWETKFSLQACRYQVVQQKICESVPEILRQRWRSDIRSWTKVFSRLHWRHFAFAKVIVQKMCLTRFQKSTYCFRIMFSSTNWGPPQSRAMSPIVKASLTYLMWIIIKILNNNNNRKQRKVYIYWDYCHFFFFDWRKTTTNRTKALFGFWAKVNFTSP